MATGATAYCGCPANALGHPVCPDCKAVGHGNMFCDLCLNHSDLSDDYRQMLLEANARRRESEGGGEGESGG